MDYGYDKIAAIPTKYNGVQFRSRLEAKWAAMFDLLKWKWEYEPFDLNGWIPDFILKNDTRILIEVKPVIKFPVEEAIIIGNVGMDINVLILGLELFADIGKWGWGPFRGPGFGWLGDAQARDPFDPEPERELRDPNWDCAAFLAYNDGRYGFTSNGGYWQDFIHGHHAHDEKELFEHHIYLPEIEDMWKEAANTVQWKAPYR